MGQTWSLYPPHHPVHPRTGQLCGNKTRNTLLHHVAATSLSPRCRVVVLEAESDIGSMADGFWVWLNVWVYGWLHDDPDVWNKWVAGISIHIYNYIELYIYRERYIDIYIYVLYISVYIYTHICGFIQTAWKVYYWCPDTMTTCHFGVWNIWIISLRDAWIRAMDRG